MSEEPLIVWTEVRGNVEQVGVSKSGPMYSFKPGSTPGFYDLFFVVSLPDGKKFEKSMTPEEAKEFCKDIELAHIVKGNNLKKSGA